MVVEEVFSSVLALDVWLGLYGDFVSVVEVEFPSSDVWAYEVSGGLSLPGVKVKYINFFPDDLV